MQARINGWMVQFQYAFEVPPGGIKIKKGQNLVKKKKMQIRHDSCSLRILV